MTYTASFTCLSLLERVPVNCPRNFIGRHVGPCRILLGFVRVIPLRLWKAHSEMAVTSAPVSILKWVSVPSSFSETVQGEVFPEFKTPRNAVSKLSSSALAATVFEKHWELKWPFLLHL